MGNIKKNINFASDALAVDEIEENVCAKTFCNKFIHQKDRPKYLFGICERYAKEIIKHIEIEGFIDDFTSEVQYLNKPVIPMDKVPKDGLVLILSTGRPLSAISRVASCGLEYLDYFSFYKYSELPLKDILFNEGFAKEFHQNRPKYDWIYELLSDKISKVQFHDLVNFRLSYDLIFLDKFKQNLEQQYFEPFLCLKNKDEVFVDAGGYDGYTSEQFIKRCPKYQEIFFFEPHKDKLSIAKKKLKQYKNIHYFQLGLSDKKEAVWFETNDSASKISKTGSLSINVDSLDNLINRSVSFIKMDIEGSESLAIAGATTVIKQHHPKLAISVYHKVGDFWKIPELIFSIRDDYKIYMRHYTESIYETVMFFIPVKGSNL